MKLALIPHRLLAASALSFVALLAFACGSEETPVGETIDSPILNSRLQDLTIVTGTTVVWDNVSGPQHTVTSGTPAEPTGVFASEFLSRGDTLVESQEVL